MATEASKDASATKRPRGRPVKPGLREARLKAIVQAAYTVFTEHGYERTSMSDIARQANLGQGTVYRYVRSKRELLDHVFDFAISKAARALNIGSLVSLDLTDYEESVKVSTMFGHRLFALVDEDPAIIRLITVQSSGIDPELRYRVVSLISTLHAAIAQLFQKANPDKTSDDDRKTWDLLARMVMGMAAPGFVMSIEQTASEERRERYMATAAAITDRGLLARVPETGVPAKEPG